MQVSPTQNHSDMIQKVVSWLSLLISLITVGTIIYQAGRFTSSVENQSKIETEHFDNLTNDLKELTTSFNILRDEVVKIDKRFPYNFEDRFETMWYKFGEQESKD